MIKIIEKAASVCDPRLVVIISNLGLVIIAKAFFYLQRSWAQILLTCLCAMTVELILFKVSRKYESQSIKGRILSSLAEASGCLALVRSKFLWLHPAMITIAILSKYCLKKDRQNHIFNPVNFAIITLICLFPSPFFELRPDDYSYAFYYPLFHIILLGSIAIVLANVWAITLAYFTGLLIFSWPILASPYGLIHVIGPEMGPPGLIFAFFMITDPKTIPEKKSLQALVGFIIAIVYLIMRQHEVVYARYIAAFFTAGLFYFCNVMIQSVIKKRNELKGNHS